MVSLSPRRGPGPTLRICAARSDSAQFVARMQSGVTRVACGRSRIASGLRNPLKSGRADSGPNMSSSRTTRSTRHGPHCRDERLRPRGRSRDLHQGDRHAQCAECDRDAAIQGLEHDLKVRLLHRTTRSVTVTAEGATYYERVVRLLADLADIESSAMQSLAKPSGRVRAEAAAATAAMVIATSTSG
jgi:hypothetical protein